MKNTTIQLSKRQSTIHHLRPWPSSMDGAASKVVLYQKYAVSELLTHSSTGFPSNTGHFAHGKGKSHLRCLDADYHGVNRCYEPYRSTYLDRVEEVVDAPDDAIPIPPSQGCIVFHTPRAPCRIRCPRPNSIRKRGTPSRISITKKGMRKAPETCTNIALINF
ncbi:hypothetical protein ALC53_12334 [Atta colombica]|uniref:Uncharacterized protein n=1 Tax=Atta colombica TaxID=520822 RepID=A0A195AYP1_9HYME|nr:hypothetical protein ALC53_12334 [Atta colombica]